MKIIDFTPALLFLSCSSSKGTIEHSRVYLIVQWLFATEK